MGEVIENPERMDILKEDIKGTCSYVIDVNKFLNMDKNVEFNTLLILNQKINIGSLFYKLWSQYTVKICADGAANMLYDFFSDEIERSKFLPNYIIGDLDSIKKEVLEYYRKQNVIVIKQTTQYSTDFTKCVNLITLHFYSEKFHEIIGPYMKNNDNDVTHNYGIETEKGIEKLYDELIQFNNANNVKLFTINILALNAIGGRFDQTIHSITQLYNLKKNDPYIKLIYLTETDIIFLVPKSGCLIEYDEKFNDEVIGNCGILPIGDSTKILQTQGLKWDVKNWETSISSGRVSSSNRFVGKDKCYINVEDDVVINVEIKLSNLIKYIE